MDKLGFDDIKKVVDCDETDKVADYLIETGCYLIDLSKKRKIGIIGRVGLLHRAIVIVEDLFLQLNREKKLLNF